ncbi:MAG: AMP-binding protein [Litorimonas sp.]
MTTAQTFAAEPLSKAGEGRIRRTLMAAFLGACSRHGADMPILTDGDGRKLTYGELRRATFALSGPLRRATPGEEAVGVLLPTGAGAVIALLALHAAGRVPAMLNFTAGSRNLKAAARTAPFRTVVTARKFVELGGLESLIEEISEFATILYLEDIRETLSATDKLRAVAGPLLPSLFLPRGKPDDTGIILFTSGTEGAPKGVVLSHANILANVEQIEEHVEILPTDIFFNPLPTFHCYGLTAGTLWPVFSGRHVVLHPSPLQTKTIAQRISDTQATVLFATDTFLQQYMRASADGGMDSLRIAVCGAERVREETRATAERRFGFEVLEGYGVTECAPVLAANQPGQIRAGTIGRMLPGLEGRLEPVEGLVEGGRLLVRGPNVMKGYIKPDAPGRVVGPKDGWHDTGDVVSRDEDGHLVVRGRMKRFAKIGGEMVSLAVVENNAAALWPDHMHAAAILPDPKRGEQIVLLTERTNAKRGDLMSWAQAHGVPEISVPKKIVTVDALPVLGTGKMDYVGVTRMAEAALAA